VVLDIHSHEEHSGSSLGGHSVGHSHWQVSSLNFVCGALQLGVKFGPGPTPGVHE
jgi:hypothetical protein